MIQRFSSLSVHEKQACFPGCPFFVFFLKSIIAETFPHLYTNGALSFYFLFPIIGQLTDKCNPFFYKLRSSSASACACSRYQPSSSSSASTNSIYSFSVASFTSRLNCSREIFIFNASYPETALSVHRSCRTGKYSVSRSHVPGILQCPENTASFHQIPSQS